MNNHSQGLNWDSQNTHKGEYRDKCLCRFVRPPDVNVYSKKGSQSETATSVTDRKIQKRIEGATASKVHLHMGVAYVVAHPEAPLIPLNGNM